MSFKPPAREHRYSLETEERQDRNLACQLAGKVQQEFQRQRWLSALPEARDPLPETALGGEPLRVPPPQCSKPSK